MDDKPIINRTGRAVVSIALMAFAMGTIVWLLLYGTDKNSLHISSLSWSYLLLCVAAGALGLDAAIAKIIPLLVTPKAAP